MIAISLIRKILKKLNNISIFYMVMAIVFMVTLVISYTINIYGVYYEKNRAEDKVIMYETAMKELIWFLKDPTYDEVKFFVTYDKTNNFTYKEDFNCVHFTSHFIANATSAGLRCGFASIDLAFPQGGHAIAVFNTTDEGLVYVEPQDDTRHYPEVGKEYGDTFIDEIRIYWIDGKEEVMIS